MTNTSIQQRDQPAQPGQPRRDLDLYNKAVDPSLTDEFLNDNNLGLGYLSEAEVYQQIESFQMGMYGDAAFADLLDARRVEETKRALALHGYTYFTDDGEQKEISGWHDKNEDSRSKKDRRQYIERRGQEIWDALPDEQQIEAIIDKSGVPDWMPPQFRMVLMRHESSKSKDARTQDNLFGRVKKLVDESGSNGSTGAKERLRKRLGRSGGGDH